MLIYVNITDRQTDKHIKSIVRDLTKFILIYLKKEFLVLKTQVSQHICFYLLASFFGCSAFAPDRLHLTGANAFFLKLVHLYIP